MLEVQPTAQPTAPAATVSLTDAAALKLRELTAEETNPAIGLRVYVYSRRLLRLPLRDDARGRPDRRGQRSSRRTA